MAPARPWIVAMTVTLATFMEVLDSSIANVALPHIAGGLGATQDEATWVLTAYLVANAIILPAGAYMTTFIGRKKFYMICVALFGISSALCGLAPTLPLLVFCRVLQGAGGGGLAPSEQAILADTFPPEEARAGVCDVWAGGGVRAGDRADAGRLHHRQLRLALDLLPQRADLPAVAVPDFAHRGRPAVGQEAGRKSKKGGMKLDFTSALGCWPLTFGSLEFVLDKGQEDDWFGSHSSRSSPSCAWSRFVTMIWWELKQLRIGNIGRS
jgi:DHA2 family multidrug resistance protein